MLCASRCSCVFVHSDRFRHCLHRPAHPVLPYIFAGGPHAPAAHVVLLRAMHRCRGLAHQRATPQSPQARTECEAQRWRCPSASLASFGPLAQESCAGRAQGWRHALAICAQAVGRVDGGAQRRAEDCSALVCCRRPWRARPACGQASRSPVAFFSVPRHRPRVPLPSQLVRYRLEGRVRPATARWRSSRRQPARRRRACDRGPSRASSCLAPARALLRVLRGQCRRRSRRVSGSFFSAQPASAGPPAPGSTHKAKHVNLGPAGTPGRSWAAAGERGQRAASTHLSRRAPQNFVDGGRYAWTRLVRHGRVPLNRTIESRQNKTQTRHKLTAECSRRPLRHDVAAHAIQGGSRGAVHPER